MSSPLVITRNFPHSQEAVYSFITENENLLKWWGIEGSVITDQNLDFTKTGPWFAVMSDANGKRYKVSGNVTNIDEPNFIELNWAWHDENDNRGHQSQVRFEVSSIPDGGTHFRLIHSGLESQMSENNHKQGWISSLAKLERLISA